MCYTVLNPLNYAKSFQVPWSAAMVAGSPLSSLLHLNDEDRAIFATATKRKAYEIIKSKGFTSYGISAAMTSICEAIIFDQRQIFPLSHWQEDLQCCLSLPAILGKSGIVSTIHLPLDENESKLLTESAKTLRAVISKYVPRTS
jgi:L-lactate dehydrogenase